MAHEVAPGQSVTTGFTISDTNSANPTATDSTTSAQINLSGDFGKLANYVQVTSSGSDATLSLTPAAQLPGSGASLAVLHGVGPNTTLNALINVSVAATTGRI